MRRLTVFGFVSLFLSTAASAQTDSKGNISFGYSYVQFQPERVVQLCGVQTGSLAGSSGGFGRRRWNRTRNPLWRSDPRLSGPAQRTNKRANVSVRPARVG